MIKFKNDCKSWLYIPFLLILLLMTACIVDDDDSSISTSITGMAASGAPIVGTANIRGANGNISTSAIEADGSYTVDVDALTAPFLIWAEGKANGKTVRLYSTVQAAGEVANVTPATNMVMTMALGDDPAAIYGDYGEGDVTADAALPEVADVVAAAADVNALLATVFASLDMPADFDLMKGSFEVSTKGFDTVLDTVSFQVNGTDPENVVVTIADKSTEAPLYEKNTSTGEVAVQLTAVEVESIVSAGLTFQEAALAIMKKLEVLYATSVPTEAQLQSELGPYMASDALDDGMDAATMFEQWALGEEGPPVGFTVNSVNILREMKTQTCGSSSLSEKGSYTEANWCNVSVTLAGAVTEEVLFSFVRDTDGVVKFYGNRVPFMEGGNLEVSAVQEINNGTAQIYSGFNFWINDFGNVAADNYGIDTVVVLHPGFPELFMPGESVSTNGFMFAQNIGDTQYQLISCDTTHYLMFTDDDLDFNVEAFNVGDEFVFVGLDFFNDDGSYKEIPVLKNIWMNTLNVKPVTSSTLTAAYFPAFTAPDLASPVDTSSSVTLSWTMPTAYDGIADRASINWTESFLVGEYMDTKNPAGSAGWTTTTFDTSSSSVVPASSFGREVNVYDETGSKFKTYEQVTYGL